MEALITVFDWRRQWLTVVCSISSIIWAEDTNWRPGLGMGRSVIGRIGTQSEPTLAEIVHRMMKLGDE